MVWFKVDDNLAFHHKAMAAGNPAIGMWVRAGSFCAQQLTDGFVPDHMVPTLGTKALAAKLVAAGLWHRVRNGFQFHEWETYQPTKSEVEKKRAEARDRMGRNRQNSRVGSSDVRANTERTSDAVTPTPSRPVPTHAAAAASEPAGSSSDALPGDVEILRSKLAAYTALANLRFDISAANIAELQALIHTHGDDRLVAVALKTCKSTPPTYVSGFLGTWRTMPVAGVSVAAVSEPVCRCGKTRRAHDAAEKLVPVADRHDFEVAA